MLWTFLDGSGTHPGPLPPSPFPQLQQKTNPSRMSGVPAASCLPRVSVLSYLPSPSPPPFSITSSLKLRFPPPGLLAGIPKVALFPSHPYPEQMTWINKYALSLQTGRTIGWKWMSEMEEMLYRERTKPVDALFQGFYGLFRTSSDSW